MAGSYFARLIGEQMRNVNTLRVRSIRGAALTRSFFAKPVFQLRLAPVKPEALTQSSSIKLRTAILPSWLLSFCKVVMAEQPASQAEKQVAEEPAKTSDSDQDNQDLPLKEIAECIVYDADGKEHRFGSFYENNVVIVVFVRHFLCYVCKEYVEDLALLSKEKLKTPTGEPVRLLVIGCAKPKFIQSFRDAAKYEGELYVDPDLTLYKKLGLSETMGGLKAIGGKSPHVHSSTVPGFLNSFKRTIQARGQSQGPVTQQGGSFILGPSTNVCKWAHRDVTPFDHTPINKLLEIVGIGPIDFAAERRARSHAQ